MASRIVAFDVPTETKLRELASFDAGDAAVVSLYLDTDGRRFPRRADYEKATSDALRRLDSDAIPRAARPGVEADTARITDYVTKELDRSGVGGIAIFACKPKGLWEIYRLPVSVRTHATADRHPHILRLEAVITRAERFVTALVSRDKARLFVTRLGSTTELAEMLDDEVPGKHAQGGRSQANFSRHVDELAARHYKHVADVLFKLSKKDPFDHLVLAGPDEALTVFEKSLHTYLQDKIAGRVSLAMAAGLNDVREATRAVEEVLESERASDAVIRVLEEFAANRNAVVGMAATLQALQDSRVEILAVQEGVARSGFACPACKRLATDGAECASCGAPLTAVADLHEEMVDEALRRRCRVVTAETRPLPEGVGALLRF